jgi:hypothetical protein
MQSSEALDDVDLHRPINVEGISGARIFFEGVHTFFLVGIT